jgi:O-antigen ligase
MVISQRKVGNIGAFLFAFLLFGFPIQSFVPFILNVDSTPINIPIRILFVLISLFLIFIHFYKNAKNSVSRGWFAFIFFWIIYSIRLIYDLEVKELIYLDTNKFYVYSFAFGTCLLPSTAIYYAAKYINLEYLVFLFFCTILFSNICLFYSVLSFGHWNILEIIINRANVNIEIDGETKSIINPITIGFFGELLSIVAIHVLNFKLINRGKYFKLLLYLCICLGVINLILGASRGPMLSFIILLIIELYFVAQKNKFSVVYISKILLISTSVILFFVYYAVTKIDVENVSLLNRLSSTADARQFDEKEERDYLFESAWNQFLSSPIIGDSFLTKALFRSYSHNIILDVLMSTGLIGITIFGIMLYHIFIKFKYNLNSLNPNNKVIKLPLLIFISILLINMTSGGLFVSGDFWMFSAFMLSFNNKSAD